MHPADRAILGEPALAGGLVDLPPAIRALRPGDPLEDSRADPAAQAISSIQASHTLIIGAAEIRRAASAAAPRLGREFPQLRREVLADQGL